MTEVTRRYGQFEYKPVISEGQLYLCFAHGKWRPLHMADFFMGGQELTKADFDKRFPNLQDLPTTAFQDGSTLSQASE